MKFFTHPAASTESLDTLYRKCRRHPLSALLILKIGFGVALVTAATLFCSPARADSLASFVYSGGTFTAVSVPGAINTYVSGINNNGQIVGSYSVPGKTGLNGFIDSGGTFTPVLVPDASDTRANGINDAAQIVGWYSTAPTNQQTYLYSGGTFTTISVPACPPPTCMLTAAAGINNQGTIVGSFTNGNNAPSNGFLDSGGAFTTLAAPGAYDTFALGINNTGLVVGGFIDPDGSRHGFLYNDGAYTPINVPGATNTVAVGINANGVIVGTYQDGNSNSTNGFLYSNGTFTTMDMPGTTDTFLTGINDEGQIVGSSDTATPVPEPASILLVASGLLMMGISLSHAKGFATKRTAGRV